MGQTACLRLIRDRFIAGHGSCELRRHLDCLPPDTPLRDIVDRCRVWESHADPLVRRVSKPMPEPAYPAYIVKKPEYEAEPVRTVTVNKPDSSVDQNKELLKKLLAVLTPAVPAPAREPEPSPMDKLIQLLIGKLAKITLTPVEPTKLETMLRTYFVKLMELTPSRVSPIVAKEAHTDGTILVQCQSDDQIFMQTTIMQMPMDYLEIPEPSLPRGFLELAEEARNVNIESEQCCYTDEVQTQEAGLTRPVFVTVMEYGSSVLNVGATIAPGISTERIPPICSAERGSPVDQLGLVGPWNKTVQSVLTGSDTNDGGTDPAGPVGPDVSVD